MSATLYIEGGSIECADVSARCRKAFRTLLERCGFSGRLPALKAPGSRNTCCELLVAALTKADKDDYVAMLIDSEAPVKDVEKAWAHLEQNDGWKRPEGASDDQVLFMANCMETWIATDREAVKRHFERPKPCVNEKALPPQNNVESRLPVHVLGALVRSTKSCKTTYEKGSESYRLVAELDPNVLRKHLPSFVRCVRVLETKL